jgi:hypothetical protein
MACMGTWNDLVISSGYLISIFVISCTYLGRYTLVINPTELLWGADPGVFFPCSTTRTKLICIGSFDMIHIDDTHGMNDTQLSYLEQVESTSYAKHPG